MIRRIHLACFAFALLACKSDTLPPTSTTAPAARRAPASEATAPPAEAPAAPAASDAAIEPSAASTAAVPEAPQRCLQIRQAIEAEKDLPSLRASLTESKLGLKPGESAEISGDLFSFCVLVEPGMAAQDCVEPLGFSRPIVLRAMTRMVRWEIHNLSRRKGKPATRAPRYGPAAVFPVIADPPRGAKASGFPDAFGLSGEDTLVEICFVERQIGE
jgi:hypothetical protein